jgi:predicted signal transduction protein with EAL and GGDEF domain
MRNADMALYRSKATGGAACAYDPSLRARAEPARQEERCAGRGAEQFLLQYQPVVDRAASVGGFRGAAALAQPELGRYRRIISAAGRGNAADPADRAWVLKGGA